MTRPAEPEPEPCAEVLRLRAVVAEYDGLIGAEKRKRLDADRAALARPAEPEPGEDEARRALVNASNALANASTDVVKAVERLAAIQDSGLDAADIQHFDWSRHPECTRCDRIAAALSEGKESS